MRYSISVRLTFPSYDRIAGLSELFAYGSSYRLHEQQFRDAYRRPEDGTPIARRPTRGELKMLREPSRAR